MNKLPDEAIDALERHVFETAEETNCDIFAQRNCRDVGRRVAEVELIRC